MRALATSRTRQIKLESRAVLPGFIDAHTHLSFAALRHLRLVDCDLRSIADIQAAICERAAKTLPGQWVVGFK